jgi:hypothetical protein
MWIVITGNITHGFRFYGPFQNMDEAHEFGDHTVEYPDDNWQAFELTTPEVLKMQRSHLRSVK